MKKKKKVTENIIYTLFLSYEEDKHKKLLVKSVGLSKKKKKNNFSNKYRHNYTKD